MKKLIFGLDPGSRCTGFGVIEAEGDRLRHIHHGVVSLPQGWSLARRLHALNQELQRLLSLYPPTVVVIERVFFGKNADSAFKLGHARGVCLMAAAQHGAPVAEYAARFVKKNITGSGAAEKQTVQLMIMQLLGLNPKEFAFDASDALSLAVTHARIGEVEARLQQMLEGSP